jgi:hypothetical protein
VLIGINPLSTTVACTTQNATNITIDCGNGTTIPSANGTCTYTTPGYYSAICRVNDSITNANCQKNIQVDAAPFCGDGIRNGTESCDPTDPTKSGWGTATPGCSNTCVPLNLPAPSCNSISVSPTTGTTPLSSVVSCNTTSATSVSIDCGNGQVINSANGTCNYTTAGTFAPRCTVNGNITGTSCVGSVTASTPIFCGDGARNGNEACDPTDATKSGWGTATPGCSSSCEPLNLPPSCVPGQTTGPQTKELDVSSTGLCPSGVSVGNFNSTTNGSTKNYSWSCGNSTVG